MLRFLFIIFGCDYYLYYRILYNTESYQSYST